MTGKNTAKGKIAGEPAHIRRPEQVSKGVYGSTVLSFLIPERRCSARELFRIGGWCNEWAKETNGSTRRELYKAKGECCRRLMRPEFSETVDVRGDSDRHRGLLSIGLLDDLRRRLHSHENWMLVGSERGALSHETPNPSRAA